MDKKAEELKGRVKEAAGVLTENKKLERAGKADQAAAKVKKTVSRVAEKAKKAIHKAVDKVGKKIAKT